jgi:NOL1/NOP2/fmu family ribosome biogenesis protein
MAAVRKRENNAEPNTSRKQDNKRKGIGKTHGKDERNKATIDMKKVTPALLSQLDCEATLELTAEGTLRAIPTGHKSLHDALTSQGLYLLQSGIEMGTIKGRDIIPAHALALSIVRKGNAFPTVEVDLDTALNYLRHEAITLDAAAPTGYVIVTYHGIALGFVKNLGNRSNNLYPQEWRIRFV